VNGFDDISFTRVFEEHHHREQPCTTDEDNPMKIAILFCL
jgi:hypothetical protein